MVGWFNGPGNVGIAPAPEGGARFNAGPLGASGTEAGGTGGGRSWNIWAEAEAGKSATSATASASAGKDQPARPCFLKPLPLAVMTMLFTENAANSSLGWQVRGGVTTGPIGTPNIDPAVVAQSQSLPSSLSTGINHAC
jgi:hypothetical protein